MTSNNSYYKLNDQDKNLLQNSLQFNFKWDGVSPTKPYGYILTNQNNIASNQTSPNFLLPSPADGNWLFDVRSGILFFPDYDSNIVDDVNNKPVLTFYTYVGRRGGVNVSITNYSNANFNNVDISGNIDLCGNLTLSGDLILNNLSQKDGNYTKAIYYDQITGKIAFGNAGSSSIENENISVNVGDISYLITYDISVINSLYVSGDISINSDLSLGYNLYVDKDLTVNNNLLINGLISGENIYLSDTIISLGSEAGRAGLYSIAIGDSAGKVSQKNYTIAIGNFAAETNQGEYSLALGYEAGRENQGAYSIAIGNKAGYQDQCDNTIILNATNSQLNSTISNSLYIKPIREIENMPLKSLYYDVTSGEITYYNSFSNTTDESINVLNIEVSNNLRVQNVLIKNLLDHFSKSRNLTFLGGDISNSDSSFSMAYSLDGIDYIGIKDSSNILSKVNTIVYDNSRNIWFAGGTGNNYSLAYSHDAIEWHGIENSKNGLNEITVIKIINDITILGGKTNGSNNNSIGYTLKTLPFNFSDFSFINFTYQNNGGGQNIDLPNFHVKDIILNNDKVYLLGNDLSTTNNYPLYNINYDT